MKRCWEMTGFEPRQSIALERETIHSDVGTTQPGAGHEHEDGKVLFSTGAPCLGYPAVVAVITNHKGERACCPLA